MDTAHHIDQDPDEDFGPLMPSLSLPRTLNPEPVNGCRFFYKRYFPVITATCLKSSPTTWKKYVAPPFRSPLASKLTGNPRIPL